MSLSLVAAVLALLAHGDTTKTPAKSPPPAAPAGASSGAATTGAPALLTADSIVVEKGAHRLTLYHGGIPFRSYLVALGRNPVGDKVRAGDRRTPEGRFRIDWRNPQSRYHLSLHVSYPDSAHAARAAMLGVSPGGDIMIHGLPDRYRDVGAAHREDDWTDGCIAVTDEEIEEIWRAVPDGIPIDIRP